MEITAVRYSIKKWHWRESHKEFIKHNRKHVLLTHWPSSGGFFLYIEISTFSDDEIQSAGPSGRFDAQHTSHANSGAFYVKLPCRYW